MYEEVWRMTLTAEIKIMNDIRIQVYKVFLCATYTYIGRTQGVNGRVWVRLRMGWRWEVHFNTSSQEGTPPSTWTLTSSHWRITHRRCEFYHGVGVSSHWCWVTDHHIVPCGSHIYSYPPRMGSARSCLALCSSSYQIVTTTDYRDGMLLTMAEVM